jgi:hypothetical protein
MMTRTELLQEHGIIDRLRMNVQPIQERNVLSLVAINGVGDPVKAFSAKQAAELAGRLQSIGENELAHRISAAAKKAQDSNLAAVTR